MIQLWICEICGEAYIGEHPPPECPFCGAHQPYIKTFEDAKVNFDVELNETDRQNVERALEVAVSNATFYFCAAKKTESPEGKKLFKILGKVEKEHASVWKKILKLKKIPEGDENCWVDYSQNLQDSHSRETRAIEFYKYAADVAESPRVKEIFESFVEVETDHLELSKQRLGK